MDSRFEDILQQAIERLAAGDALDEVLRAHPEDASRLRPLLAPARELIASPRAKGSEQARAAALGRMLSELSTARAAHAGSGFFASIRSQPAFRAAALAGAVALFGAASLGAAAATGSAPEPVRHLFGFTDESSIRIEFKGVVQSVDAPNGMLTVAAGADVRTVIVTASTELSRGGDAVALSDMGAGSSVEVKGRLRADNAIIASRVRLEDDDGSATPTGGGSTPVAIGDDDGDDDRSGPDEGDDDAGDDGEDAGSPVSDPGDDPVSGDDDAEDTPETEDDDDRTSTPEGSDDDADETATPDHDEPEEHESETPEPDDTPEPGDD